MYFTRWTAPSHANVPRRVDKGQRGPVATPESTAELNIVEDPGRASGVRRLPGALQTVTRPPQQTTGRPPSLPPTAETSQRPGTILSRKHRPRPLGPDTSSTRPRKSRQQTPKPSQITPETTPGRRKFRQELRNTQANQHPPKSQTVQKSAKCAKAVPIQPSPRRPTPIQTRSRQAPAPRLTRPNRASPGYVQTQLWKDQPTPAKPHRNPAASGKRPDKVQASPGKSRQVHTMSRPDHVNARTCGYKQIQPSAGAPRAGPSKVKHNQTRPTHPTPSKSRQAPGMPRKPPSRSDQAARGPDESR